MAVAWILAGLWAVTGPVAAAPDCAVDHSAMMALSVDDFDQDMDGGWRALADRPGCRQAAAELIAAYRRLDRAAGVSLLAWHEAQIRAGLGQTAQAIALMEQAYKPAAQDRAGWNLYVDGSLAFLRGDRAALQQARAGLAGIAPPPGLAVSDGHITASVNGKDARIPWPPNLEVLDGLLRCFDRPYDEAYGSRDCRAPAGA